MIKLTKIGTQFVQKGYPWVWKGWVESPGEFKGDIVRISGNRGEDIGIGYANSTRTLFSRVLAMNPHEAINETWIRHKLQVSLHKRNKLFTSAFYRLVYSESDGLPGLIVDRYGQFLVCQFNTAGIDLLSSSILRALTEIIRPEGIVIDNTSSYRKKEGLSQFTKILYKVPNTITVRENGISYYCHLLKGQKSGWFFDQSYNRKYIQKYCPGKTVLDLFCYSGGFGLSAAKAGASRVTMVDTSKEALNLTTQSISTNQLTNVETIEKDVFSFLKNSQEKYDIVIADPPAFVKDKGNSARGLRKYKELIQLCEAALEPKGQLFLSCCSQSVSLKTLLSMHRGETIRTLKASQDHPSHPFLPQLNYLKFLHLQYS